MRFHITTKARKSTFSSGLLQIEGIGEKKAKALLRHFKTIGKIKECDEAQLRECPSISEKTRAIFTNFIIKCKNNIYSLDYGGVRLYNVICINLSVRQCPPFLRIFYYESYYRLGARQKA